MRLLVGFSILLALAAPSAVSAGSVDSKQFITPQPDDPLRITPRLTRIRTDPALQCETAVTSAEYAYRLPPRLLNAISLTETGRIDPVAGHIRPWPWTINAEGTGTFFETKQQAVAAVKMLQARGVQSVDVGCMQINLLYHPDAFGSLDDAFDPGMNAAYGARFLNALHAGDGTWAHAIAAYHSETPDLGNAYRVLVISRWQNDHPHDGDPQALVPASTAYRDFAGGSKVYAAFAAPSRVYGAFAATQAGRDTTPPIGLQPGRREWTPAKHMLRVISRRAGSSLDRTD